MSDLPPGCTDSMLPGNSSESAWAEEIVDAIVTALEDMNLDEMEEALYKVTGVEGKSTERIAKLEADNDSLKRSVKHDAKTIQKQAKEIEVLKDKLAVAGKMLARAPVLPSHHEVLNLVSSVEKRLGVEGENHE